MTNIDKQRVAAVRKLEELGYTFAGEWMRPANDASVAVLVPTVTDPMHALLVRADVLEGCQKGSVMEAELGSLSTRWRPIEELRWPLGEERRPPAPWRLTSVCSARTHASL